MLYYDSMVYVIKANGEKEPFDEEKVRSSIFRAGIPQSLEDQVVAHVKSRLYENIPTSEIFHHIVEFLGSSPAPYTRAKYSLKQSIMDLGPTGYPFEDFVAEILKAQGYETSVRNMVKGVCVYHEIDVIAQKKNERLMIEAKFHNNSGIRTDLHVALYTKARLDDVREKNNFTKACIVTNTKVTSETVAYGNCMGMNITSWSYPSNGSLRDLIEKSHLIPITALTTLSQTQKQILLQNGVVLCKTICETPSLLNTLHLPNDKLEEIITEAHFVCRIGPEAIVSSSSFPLTR